MATARGYDPVPRGVDAAFYEFATGTARNDGLSYVDHDTGAFVQGGTGAVSYPFTPSRPVVISSAPPAIGPMGPGPGQASPLGDASSAFHNPTVTRGPGNLSVGDASETRGPGVIRVGAPVGTGPGLGVITLGDPFGPAMLTDDVPLKRIGSGQPNESLGAISDFGWSRTMNGYQLVPSNDMKQRMDDDIIQQTSWFWRNIVTPGLLGGEMPIPPAYQDGWPQNYQYNILGEVTPYNRSWQSHGKAGGGGF